MTIIAIFIMALVSCNKEPNTINTNTQGTSVLSLKEQLKEQSQVVKFSSEDELQAYLTKNQASSSSLNYYGGNGGIRRISAMDSIGSGVMEKSFDSAAPVSAPTSNSGSPQGNAGNFDGDGVSDYSITNVQVEGVDEADIVKTDGDYIYAVSGNTVFIIDAKKLEVTSKITFKAQPSEIYINANNLVIFGNDYGNDKIMTMYPSKSFTYFKIFDTTDKTNPIEVKTLEMEGYYSNSRMIGDYIYILTDNYLPYYANYEKGGIVPVLLDGEGKTVGVAFPDVYYFRMPYQSYKFTTISAINVADLEKDVTREVYMLSDTQNVFVSQNNIYLTYTKYISEYDLVLDVTKEIVLDKLSDAEKTRIQKIEAVDSDVLSDTEKRTKIMQIVEGYVTQLTNKEQEDLQTELKAELKSRYENIANELEKTVIHKISIDQDKIEYQKSSEVPGRVLNQFSMDEKDGFFRIATTKDRTWSYIWSIINDNSASSSKDAVVSNEQTNEQKSYNNMYVLDSDMSIVGKLENVAEGEQIYSVRFMQDRAYMVTFEQTDPLFVIDLSDNTNPKVLGQLKVPGFSNYLHPYDDTHLIGIGQDTKENKYGGIVTSGLKLSLFDVSDVANPTEVDSYKVGDIGSTSQALYDHKAFLFSLDKNLLVIPAEIRETAKDNEYWGKLSFSGALVFHLDESGFKLEGKVDHSDATDKKNMNDQYWYSNYETSVKRSLYIDDKLYTLSNKYIKANDLSDLTNEDSLELKQDEYVVSGGYDDGYSGSSGSGIVPMPIAVK